MTLPASGAISTAQIRNEIGGSGSVAIPSSETRTLSGVGSGSIVLPNDFHGKSGAGGGGGFTASNNGPALASGAGPSLTTNTVTATPSGGTGPYTYAWSYVSGDTFTVNSSTSATTSFTGSPGDGNTLDGFYRCTVTDSLSATATTTTRVTIQDTDPAP